MDWVLDPPTPETSSALRAEIAQYLRRHAADPAQVGFAELAVSELLSNAVEHVGGTIWVCLEWGSARPVLSVHDVGPVFKLDLNDPDVTALRGRGLWLVSQLAGDLAIAAKRGGGKRVSVTLPVDRSLETSIDPPGRVVDPMPDADEAGPHGFGRESFLRALVVELARTVEDRHGPGDAEELVARVGATVGGQMEAEFRAARSLVQRLTVEQIAECYVRLKAAIDGDFYVVDISQDRIVLGNRRCPFGEAVTRSPALCRMTSSVFGGIAARNRGEATVHLEERIALGDPHCRVVVELGPSTEPRRSGHHYTDAVPAA
ncbi:MAG TPA: methanogen output domain 1-containing protein [Micromonosporaceae bacterium]|nr:methanogen output domain 1-containing protein [Micromonosporaceae bacterium]